MIISLNEITQNDFHSVLSEKLNNAVSVCSEVVMDLTGIKYLDFEELKLIVSCGIKCRGKGTRLVMINVPEAIRGQLIMFGVNSRNEEVVLN